ncbi:MAG: hypothetical protein BMS9Abin06_0985 [Gammaproteobacteria bacterium]|nr:MAG: hypothetical protein BMS9Abin06_0985 [Gammaproteobacteria bacterium]
MEARVLQHPHTKFRWFTGLMSTLMLTAALFMSGCGQQSTDGAADNGQVIIGLTDAPGDFVTYSVDVVSLTLTKANGAVVETVPLRTRVDFAQYTEMTEFLTAATVPSGVYVKARMQLDYSNAEIAVENDAGDAVPVASIKDTAGNDITLLDVDVHLAGRDSLLIAPGIPAHITFDFDLKASNQVDMSDALNPALTVEPVLLADVELETPKIHRVRGPLKSVDVADNSYEVIIRPFHHAVNDHHERFGSLTVATADTTVFDIDGVAYEGAIGLQALADKTTFTATVAIGHLKGNPIRFEASQVYAGSSVPGGTLDAVSGIVLSRSGNTLAVKGATLLRADGSVIFNDTVTVQVDPSTTVRKQFSMSIHNIDDLSVGQRVSILGVVTNADPSALEMNAASGYAHMLITVIGGTRTSAAPPPFVVALQWMHGRSASMFVFDGTGVDMANDADPDNYEVDIGAVDVSSIISGAPVKLSGFVRPFGSAPDDFEAMTVVDVSAVRGVLATNWDPASAAAISAIDETGLTLNMTGAGQFHHVVRAGVRTDLAATVPVIQPRVDGGVFIISQGETAQLHSNFAEFVTDLTGRLDSGLAVKGLIARGYYADATNIHTSGLIVVRVE